jgi:hypothetical protein
MTKLERKAFLKLLNSTRDPSVPGSEYDEKLRRVELNSSAEASRLLDSVDFRKGWELCYNRMAEGIKFISSAKETDLKLFSR